MMFQYGSSRSLQSRVKKGIIFHNFKFSRNSKINNKVPS